MKTFIWRRMTLWIFIFLLLGGLGITARGEEASSVPSQKLAVSIKGFGGNLTILDDQGNCVTDRLHDGDDGTLYEVVDEIPVPVTLENGEFYLPAGEYTCQIQASFPAAAVWSLILTQQDGTQTVLDACSGREGEPFCFQTTASTVRIEAVIGILETTAESSKQVTIRKASAAPASALKEIPTSGSTTFTLAREDEEHGGGINPSGISIDNQTGQIAYCLQKEKGTPSDGDVYYYQPSADYSDVFPMTALEYVMYHGYRGEFTVDNRGFSDRDWRSITAGAVWAVASGKGPSIVAGEYPTVRYQAVAALYEEACAYAQQYPSGNDPESHIRSTMRILTWTGDGGVDEEKQAFITAGADHGNLKVQKTFAESAMAENPEYSLAGAQYTVFSDKECLQPVSGAVLTVGESGATNIVSLPLGTYYVKETEPGTGCLPDEKVYPAVLDLTHTRENNALTVSSAEPKNGAAVSLKKVSTAPELTKGNSCYSLAGAVFEVFSDRAMTRKVGTLTTNEEGCTNTLQDLLAGTYYARETKASPGYYRNQQILKVKVRPGETGIFTCEETPFADPGGLLIHKTDSLSGKETPVAGALYTMSFYPGQYQTAQEARASGPAERSWVFQTNQNGYVTYSSSEEFFVSGDELYTLNGTAQLPMGTLLIQETRAPEGYTLDPDVYLMNISDQEGAGTLRSGSGLEQEAGGASKVLQVTDTPIRGDFSLKKADGRTGAGMAGVSFRLSLLGDDGSVLAEEGYSAMITTDENGMYCSASDSSLWLGGGDPQEGYGRLPMGRYLLEEIPSEANAGYELAEPVSFTIQEAGTTIDLGTILNFPQPSIHTTLSMTDDSLLPAPSSCLSLTDTVMYRNMQSYIGKNLTVFGRLVDQEGNPITDASGRQVTAQEDFQPQYNEEGFPDGTAALVYAFDGSGMKGKTVVSLVQILQEGEVVCAHEDLMDTHQTLVFPEIQTLVSTESGLPLLASRSNVSVTDIVSYTGLIAGTTYTLQGDLYFSDMGRPAGITSETSFTPQSSSGTAEVVFTFDASSLAGKKLTAVEKLLYGSQILAVHQDLKDERQTFEIPWIHTRAAETSTKTNIAGTLEEVTLTDVVSYHGLIAGKKYQITASLADASSGDLILDQNGKPVKVVQTFTPEKSEGQETITVKGNGILLAGRTIVFLEDISYEGTTLAFHADLSDEAQRIHFPQMQTRLTAGEEKTVSCLLEEVVLTDTITYQNLIPGKEYKAAGVIMDKETGKEVVLEGRKLTAETVFTPEQPDGSVIVRFTASGLEELAGHELVCFEKLYLAEGNVLLTSHEDLQDQEQTVAVSPRPKTPPTGDDSRLALYTAVLAVAAAGIWLILMFRRWRRRQSGTVRSSKRR